MIGSLDGSKGAGGFISRSEIVPSRMDWMLIFSLIAVGDVQFLLSQHPDGLDQSLDLG